MTRTTCVSFALAVSLTAGTCDRKKDDPQPEECTADQIRVGDECLDAAGVLTCEGLLADGDGGCVADTGTCGDDQVYADGDCADVGEARDCGTGTWGDIDTTGPTLHVDGSYTGGDGDGSAIRPYPTISEALAVAASGDTVAVAGGTYAETLSVPAGVVLEGRCAEMVTVTGSGGGAVVNVDSGDGATIRGLTLTGDGPGIVLVSSDGVLVEHVVVEDTVGAGIRVRSGLGAIIGDSGIRGTQALDDTLAGTGIVVEPGAELASVERTSISGNAHAAVECEGGSFDMDRCHVWSNERGGIIISDPSSDISITSSRLSGNGWAGLIVSGAGSGTVSLADSVVEGTTDVTSASTANGDGVLALGPASLEVTGCVIRDSARFGLVVHGATGIIGDSGIYASGAGPRSDTSAGGIAAVGNETDGIVATLEIANTTLADNVGGGIMGWSADVTIEDASVSGTVPRSSGTPEGDGVMVTAGSVLSSSRVLVDGSEGTRLGFLVDGSGSTGIIGDSGIVGSVHGGVWYQDGSDGAVSTSVITQVGFAGVGLTSGAGSGAGGAVQVTGSTISDVSPGVGLSEDGVPIDWGDGVSVTDGSAATVTGNTLSGLDRAGVLYDCSTGNLSDNTITSAEYGIAVQNLDSGPVDGATTGDNDISDISGSRVAEDAGLSISTAGWTPTGF